MRHQVHKKRLGRHSSHRRAMFRNMVTSLIEEGRITTTITKAKQLRRIAEKMVTLAKRGTLHARRQALGFVRSPQTVAKLFSELGPRFAGRSGGYTRVLKLGFRRGDGADMALIEYLGFEPKVVKKAEGKADDKDKKAKAKEAAEKKKDKADAKAQKAPTKKKPVNKKKPEAPAQKPKNQKKEKKG